MLSVVQHVPPYLAACRKSQLRVNDPDILQPPSQIHKYPPFWEDSSTGMVFRFRIYMEIQYYSTLLYPMGDISGVGRAVFKARDTKLFYVLRRTPKFSKDWVKGSNSMESHRKYFQTSSIVSKGENIFPFQEKNKQGCLEQSLVKACLQ